MLVIELVSKWEIYWVLWSLVVFDPNDNLTRNNVAQFFNENSTVYCLFPIEDTKLKYIPRHYDG